MDKRQNIRWEEMNQWEIIDDKGVIYSGNGNEVLLKWEEITGGETEDEWEGDIKLVEVHGIYK